MSLVGSLIVGVFMCLEFMLGVVSVGIGVLMWGEVLNCSGRLVDM